MFGNSTLSPEMLMALGGGIMQGSNLGTGMGQGFQNAATVMGQQKEQAAVKDVENKTRAWLQQKYPGEDFSTMTPDMMRTFVTQAMQERFAKPEKPKFEVINGKIVKIDTTTGESSLVGDYSEPKVPDPTSIQRDLEAAGLQPGTPEYKQAILEHYRKSGTMVDVSPDGTVRFVQGNVDPAKMPKVTEAEGKNAGFLKRALTAEKELSALESEGTSLWNRAADAVPVLGNYAKSADAQKFDQAQRNFINAVLRRESGAVISPEEFDNARKQYFPQPGDGPDVIAQKRKNREDAITGFEIGSGPAAEKVREMDETQPKTAPIPAEDYFK